MNSSAPTDIVKNDVAIAGEDVVLDKLLLKVLNRIALLLQEIGVVDEVEISLERRNLNTQMTVTTLSDDEANGTHVRGVQALVSLSEFGNLLLGALMEVPDGI